MKSIVPGCRVLCRRVFLKVIIPCGLFLVSSLGLLAQPVVDFSADMTAVCAGTTVTFTDLTQNISGEATYAWNFGNGAMPATATGEGPHVVYYSTAGSVTVTLSVTDEAGTDEETKTDYITVDGSVPSFESCPTATIIQSADAGLCSAVVDYSSLVSVTGSPEPALTYSFSGATTGSGSGTGSGSSFNLGNTQVEIVAQNSCSTTDICSFTVFIDTPPVARAGGPYQTCSGSSVSLTGSSSYDPDAACGDIIASYGWDIDNDGIDDLEGESLTLTHAMLTGYGLGAGVHQIRLTVTDNYGVTGTDNTTLTINASPVATASNNSPVCEGTPLTLTGGPDGMTEYLWSGPDGFASTAQNVTVSNTASVDMSGTYSLTVTDASGCTGTATTDATVNSRVTPTFITTGPYCRGEIPATLPATSEEGVSGTWEPSVINTSEAGSSDYLFTPNPGQCASTAIMTVVVNALPAANAGTDRTIFEGQSTRIGSDANSGSIYAWTSDPSGFTSSEADPIVTPSTTTTYTVTETVTATGCSNSNSVVVTVNNLPASFIPPWWPGNGADHMNFYIATATLDGTNLQPGDMIAVFDGEICVGVGGVTEVLTGSNPLPVSVSRDDEYTPEIDGYTPGNSATYRIWDASEDEIHHYTTADYISGDGVFLVGATAYLNLSAVSPLTHTINISSGWNIFSSSVIPDNPSMLSVVQPLIDAGRLVKIQDEAGSALEYLGNQWYNFIGDIRPTEGYKIRVNATTSLSIHGRPVSSPIDISLTNGWNIISYCFMNSQPAMDAFEPLIDEGTLVKVQNEAGMAIEYLSGYGWIDNITNLLPGEGYKVRTNSNTTLTLTDGSGGGLKSADASAAAIHFVPSHTGNGLDHMNLYISSEAAGNLRLKEGDEIGVFDGETCVGVGIAGGHDQEFISIPVSLDDPVTVERDGYIEGNRVSLKVWRAESNAELFLESVKGHDGTPIIFVKNGTAVINSFPSLTEAFLGDAYPNPSTDMTTFPIELAGDNHIRLELFNSSGVLVRTIHNGLLSAGRHIIEWDNRDASGQRAKAGLYFYRLATGDFSSSKSLVVVN
ncbi:MAG: PKD domain-containing protein [Bacteroidales bacterium]